MKNPPLTSLPHVQARARSLLLATTVLWGTTFPILRGLQLAQHRHGSPLTDPQLAAADTAIRFGLAGFVLLAFYGKHLFSVTGREWSQAGGLALFAGLGLFLQTLGLAWTDASISAFLTQFYVPIIPLVVALRTRQWPSGRIIIACAMVLVGAAILSPGLLRHFILGPGEFVTLVGSIFFAGQIMWVERPIYAENRSGLVTLLMFTLIACLFGAAYAVMGGTRQPQPGLFQRPSTVELILALVLFCTVLSFLTMNTWQRFISSTEAGLIYSLEPVIATVLAAFLPGFISRFAGVDYPNETLHWSLLLGGSMIVAATILSATEHRQPPPKMKT